MTNAPTPETPIPFEFLEYCGGGYFRDSRVPKGQEAEIIHGPELLKRAVQLERERDEARNELEAAMMEIGYAKAGQAELLKERDQLRKELKDLSRQNQK